MYVICNEQKKRHDVLQSGWIYRLPIQVQYWRFAWGSWFSILKLSVLSRKRKISSLTLKFNIFSILHQNWSCWMMMANKRKLSGQQLLLINFCINNVFLLLFPFSLYQNTYTTLKTQYTHFCLGVQLEYFYVSLKQSCKKANLLKIES